MIKPPILNFALSRTSVNQDKPFFYDPTLNLNVIKINGTVAPFVDASIIVPPELCTKTEADTEDTQESSRLLELYTKTLVRRESDDDDIKLLELLTKTRVKRESDDE